MFFIIPIGVDYRARRYPVVTFTLIGLCILFYLVQFSCEALGDKRAVDEWVFQYLWLKPAASYWWTYITVMFVHGGFLHIAFNMIFLFVFGSCVEDLIGRVNYTIFYILCGLAADFSQILFSPEHFDSYIPFGGASGAISGCIGGFLLLLAKSWIDFKWVIFYFFGFWSGNFRLPSWLFISFWFSSDFMSMLLGRLEVHERHGAETAFAAHVGGTVFGLALIALIKIWLKRSGALDWINEQDDEPTVGILTTRPEPQASVAWHSADVRAEVRPQYRVAESAPVIAPIGHATIYLSWDGSKFGPYALSQIQPMFKRGEIPPAAFYWQDGMAEWRSAEELRDPGTG